jgi:uncharacterized protein YecE (DUF72 family)
MEKKARIHIGTSGWHYKHWIGTFYPEATKDHEQLPYYLEFFKTVELNNSFYHLPSSETFTNWAKAVPSDFIFAVKASRYITHNKKLKDPEQSLALFLDHAKHLKKKLGPILFQLPPGWKVNEERLEAFLQQLPRKHKYVFEFRNPTWYTEKVYNLLRKHNCAFCMYELAGHVSPAIDTANFLYVRLHGPGNKYEGSYTNAALKKWAKQCIVWQKKGKDVFVYFDNDQLGYAAFNAKQLQEFITVSS